MRLGVRAALVGSRRVVGDVAIEDGRITASGLDPVDGAMGTAVPGLVDLQVNGFAGVDFRTADRAGFEAAAIALASCGAVAVQPTFHGMSLDGYVSALRILAAVIDDPPDGCRFLPAHLEGPFLSPHWRGAHDPATFRAPSVGDAVTLLGAGPVGMMTVAPELPDALELIADLVGRGVVVSVGHTDADADVVRGAIDAGARHVTHLWNAHRRFAPRDPGPAGVALTDERLTVGLIADLVHTDPDVVTMTAHLCRDRLAATTDAVAFAGTTTSHHRLADGTLAGGVATPSDILVNLIRCGVEPADAVDACGGAQRRLLGLPFVTLSPGDPADLVVLDGEHRPTRTVVAGRTVWRSPDGRERPT